MIAGNTTAECRRTPRQQRDLVGLDLLTGPLGDVLPARGRDLLGSVSPQAAVIAGDRPRVGLVAGRRAAAGGRAEPLRAVRPAGPGPRPSAAPSPPAVLRPTSLEAFLLAYVPKQRGHQLGAGGEVEVDRARRKTPARSAAAWSATRFPVPRPIPGAASSSAARVRRLRAVRGSSMARSCSSARLGRLRRRVERSPIWIADRPLGQIPAPCPGVGVFDLRVRLLLVPLPEVAAGRARELGRGPAATAGCRRPRPASRRRDRPSWWRSSRDCTR
jgi:hypothetical protein